MSSFSSFSKRIKLFSHSFPVIFIVMPFPSEGMGVLHNLSQIKVEFEKKKYIKLKLTILGIRPIS